jgi:lipooligosaccharide transport system permease protein
VSATVIRRSTPASIRVWEAQVVTVWRAWKSSALLSMLQPLVFLGGMGFGVGALVDERAGSTAALGGLGYLAFLGPALMATTAMQTATFEASYPVMDGFKWRRAFEAMTATPVSPRDVVDGMVLWWVSRILVGVTGVALVLAVIPTTRGWGLIPAALGATLCGMVFATAMGAWASTRESEASFAAVQRFVIIPLFLFGGAFYPIDSLPSALRPVAWLTPLWHGVELTRGLTTSEISLAATLGHIAYLSALTLVGYLICRVTFHRRLTR